ncbi:hypothetical protein J4422_03755 [Candidatus Pacearchaeota archaeon]|nr:hypothetical protein [Candidatus Pacearchaeota archaeon]
MKQKISVTVEEKTLKLIDEIIATGIFRNKSHAVEFSLNKILKEKEGEEGK